MKKRILRFIIDKEIDIKNHFISLRVYAERKDDPTFGLRRSELAEQLLAFPESKRKRGIEHQIESYYKQIGRLKSLAKDVDDEWVKIEPRVIQRLETIHEGHPFPLRRVRGVLSSADRWGYNTQEGWFATGMFGCKFSAIDTALHELMHFMFHTYYDGICRKQGVSERALWDIKEAFTVLLNHEFTEYRFRPDAGYLPHQKLRKTIERSWIKHHNFSKALNAAIAYSKKQ